MSTTWTKPQRVTTTWHKTRTGVTITDGQDPIIDEETPSSGLTGQSLGLLLSLTNS